MGNQRTENIKRHNRLHPDRARARWIVNKHIQRGSLIRPGKCEKCGLECIPHAHHNDYSQPLLVNWLCRKCHLEHHGKKFYPPAPDDWMERIRKIQEELP